MSKFEWTCNIDETTLFLILTSVIMAMVLEFNKVTSKILLSLQR